MPGSKAGLGLSTKDSDKEFWETFSFFPSVYLYFSLYLPPPIFHSSSICSSLSPGITDTSAGERIIDKSPGVLDSATLAGAQHILACPTSCHLGLKNHAHNSNSLAQMQYRRACRTPSHTLTAEDKEDEMCYG